MVVPPAANSISYPVVAPRASSPGIRHRMAARFVARSSEAVFAKLPVQDARIVWQESGRVKRGTTVFEVLQDWRPDGRAQELHTHPESERVKII